MKRLTEVRFGADNRMRAFTIFEAPSGIAHAPKSVRVSWGKFQEPAADMVRKYTAREASMLLSSEKLLFDLEPKRVQVMLDRWRKKCVKDGLLSVCTVGDSR